MAREHIYMWLMVMNAALPFANTECSQEIECPSRCECAVSGHVDCRGRDLRMVPSGFPALSTSILLAHNQIHSINDSDFTACSSLKYLDLSSNNIARIQKSAFKDLLRLETLHIQNNTIDLHSNESLPYGSFDQLASLEELQMHNNSWQQMRSYREDVITNKPRLQNLSLDSPSEDIPLCSAFANLLALKRLCLHGGLTKVGNETLAALNTTTLTQLVLGSTEIQSLDSLAFSHLPHIDSIDLSGNKRLGLGPDMFRAWFGLRNSSIRVLKLQNVVEEFDYKAYTLRDDFFLYLNQTKLKELYLDINGLVAIDAPLHFHLPHLEKLTLSYNRFLDNIAKVLLDVYYLEHLYYLDISNQSRYPSHASKDVGGRDDHNLIVFLSPRIRHLDLSAAFPAAYNTINMVLFFTVTTYMTLIDVSDNKVGAINGRLVMSPPHNFHVEYFNLSHCGFHHLSEHLFKHSITVDITDISYNNLGPQIADDENGSCVLQLQKAQTKELNIAGNNIKTIPAAFFSHINSLERLIINNNALNTWGSSLRHMTNLTFLDLSMNLLTSLTDISFQEFEHMAKYKSLSVDLTGNPFECQCYTLSFLKWLSDTKINIVNKAKYKCHRRGILVSFQNLNDIVEQMTIECSSKNWVIVTGVACVCLIIAISLSVVLYRHRWDIRYCFLRFQRRRAQYQALEDDKHYQFDAFVAYHQDDLSWVTQQLMVKLEERPDPFKLCIHHRNWIPGPTIEENISRSVEQSRKTLVVLTRKFMDSGWCEFEMQIARMRGFEEGQQIIVVVALEDIPMKDLNRTLANLRRTNTWLDWFEHENDRGRFWELLTDALRNPNDGRVPCACGRTYSQNQL